MSRNTRETPPTPRRRSSVSYGSYAEAFRDYANLLSRSERYTDVLGQRTPEGFAHSLQKAGFATDPMYADKITRIIGGNTLRSALVS